MFDDAEIFVTEHDAGLNRSAAFVHVEIAAADGGGGDPDDRVRRFDENRIFNVIDFNVVRFLKNDCAQTLTPYVW